MTWLLILLCAVVIFTDGVKMSLMPFKMSLSWAIVWGVVAFFATIYFSGLSREESYSLMNVADICGLEFCELLIMLGYIFSGGLFMRISGYYPGFMMGVPVCVVSFILVGLLPGMEFAVIGLLSGVVTSVFLTALILLFRYARTDINALYSTVLVAVLVNVIIYGLL